MSRREGGIRGKQDIGKRKRKEDSRAGFLSGLGAKLRWANSPKGLIFFTVPQHYHHFSRSEHSNKIRKSENVNKHLVGGVFTDNLAYLVINIFRAQHSFQ